MDSLDLSSSSSFSPDSASRVQPVIRPDLRADPLLRAVREAADPVAPRPVRPGKRPGI
jgi:hypothetical protein